MVSETFKYYTFSIPRLDCNESDLKSIHASGWEEYDIYSLFIAKFHIRPPV
jgi:hypothetical protein